MTRANEPISCHRCKSCPQPVEIITTRISYLFIRLSTVLRATHVSFFSSPASSLYLFHSIFPAYLRQWFLHSYLYSYPYSSFVSFFFINQSSQCSHTSINVNELISFPPRVRLFFSYCSLNCAFFFFTPNWSWFFSVSYTYLLTLSAPNLPVVLSCFALVEY